MVYSIPDPLDMLPIKNHSPQNHHTHSLVLTSSGGHCITYGWQAGMLSCSKITWRKKALVWKAYHLHNKYWLRSTKKLLLLVDLDIEMT